MKASENGEKTVSLLKNDAEKIARLFAVGFSDGWSEASIEKSFDTGNFYALGTVGKTENLIGAITFTLAGDTADICDIVVLPDKRRQGIGKRLILSAAEEIRKSGAKKIFLEVRKSNAPAIALYLSCGFNTVFERKKYYSDGEDALVLMKEI